MAKRLFSFSLSKGGVLLSIPLIFLMVVIPSYAEEKINNEDKFKELYNRHTLCFESRFWGGAHFVQPYSGMAYNVGLLGGEIRNLILASDSLLAKEEIQKFRRKKILGMMLSFGGLGMMFATLLGMENDSPEILLALLGGGWSLVIAGTVIEVRALNHLFKAVWHYNRDILLKEQSVELNSLNGKSAKIVLYRKRF